MAEKRPNKYRKLDLAKWVCDLAMREKYHFTTTDLDAMDIDLYRFTSYWMYFQEKKLKTHQQQLAAEQKAAEQRMRRR